jgi:hypothetical protein
VLDYEDAVVPHSTAVMWASVDGLGLQFFIGWLFDEFFEFVAPWG